jgi:predicted RNA-binding Zn-ribbon protein involved in translation (DUF1610 family)
MKQKRTKGVKFLIERNDEIDELLYEASMEFLHLCNYSIKNHHRLLQILADKYGVENISLQEHAIIVDTTDLAFTGTDGNIYQFAKKVENRKKGQQVWFTLDDQEEGDIVDNTKGKITDTVMSRMISEKLNVFPTNVIKESSQLAITRLRSRSRQKTKNITTEEVIVSKDNPPYFRKHTLYSAKGLFQVTENSIIWNGLTTIEIPFTKLIDCKRDNYTVQDFIGKNIGGYLTIHQTQPMFNKHGERTKTRKNKKHHVFVMTHKVPVSRFKLNYEIKGWLSFDTNAQKGFWMTFYDSVNKKHIIVPLPEKFGSVIAERKDDNDALNNNSKQKRKDNSMNSAMCRKIRLNLKRLNRLQRKQMIHFFSITKHEVFEGLTIFDYCEKYKLGLAIDDISPGKGSGSFYQDAITWSIPSLCEQNGIPYDLVNPAFTSRDCSQCGFRHSQAQKEKMSKKENGVFTCKDCGFTGLSLHENAAINIAKKASYYVGENKKVD